MQVTATFAPVTAIPRKVQVTQRFNEEVQWADESRQLPVPLREVHRPADEVEQPAVLAGKVQRHDRCPGIADQARREDLPRQIFGVAETAMRHSLRGSAKVAVELLIQQGEATRNAKLIDMAGLVLKRHADKIDGAAGLAENIEDLHDRYVKPMSAGPGKARATGGVTLRTAPAVAAA